MCLIFEVRILDNVDTEVELMKKSKLLKMVLERQMCEANIIDKSSAGDDENYGMTMEIDYWVYTQGIFGDKEEGNWLVRDLERFSMRLLSRNYQQMKKVISDCVQTK